MRGTTLAGRYRLSDLLGAGGMGEVWSGVDERLGRRVAVKVIARPGDEDLVLRLDGEARAAAALSDPNVVAVHDVGETQVSGRRLVYLVMELVDGRSLSQVMADGRPAVDDVVRWGGQICHGLQAAHSAGVVHRDIKPANILLTADGRRVKICDFGIARRTDAVGHPLTGTGAVIGTPSYMSPEQIRGDAAIGARSDLYSLGCLLYELLTGLPPFPGAGWPVLDQHLNQAPVPVRAHRPDVPAALDRLVAQLLSKDPAQRPAAAADVARRLRAALRSPAPAALPAAGAPAPAVHAARTRTAPVQAPAPVAVPSAPGSGRSAWWPGVMGSALVGGQLALFTSLPGPATGVLGVVAGGCVAMGYALEARHEGGPADEELQITAVGLFMALGIATITLVVLLVGSSVPWWGAVLAGMVTGPVLVMGAAAVRALVEQLLQRGGPEADVAATTGLLSGGLSCALFAAGGNGSAVATVAAGVGAWIVSSLAVGVLLPSTRARGRHL
ncbi:serine/threonine-protein kinase [Streptomyces sp. RKAG337]|uniref:serine/threonine-protein kinase n=1 Tax=Streptomyces sp. RKAG337 TaxID=2893404 RepID=UPI00203323DB|nr:serine/threonine-protein kinase [Streptomyces sp. RKAG337]MCM2431064.1 serine/threonine protein kinase [Streptomyces sp. RKAG337]